MIVFYIIITRPIHDAVEAGNFEIVTILVEHGADPMVEYSERTPIEIAKSANFQEIVAYLSGTDVNKDWQSYNKYFYSFLAFFVIEICEKRKQSSQHSPVDQQEHIPTRNTTALSTSSISDNQLITLPVDGYSGNKSNLIHLSYTFFLPINNSYQISE